MTLFVLLIIVAICTVIDYEWKIMIVIISNLFSHNHSLWKGLTFLFMRGVRFIVLVGLLCECFVNIWQGVSMCLVRVVETILGLKYNPIEFNFTNVCLNHSIQTHFQTLHSHSLPLHNLSLFISQEPQCFQSFFY